ncbi:hypothetical protein PORY_001064 [Pneumocystis oryctolagi]|uniref:Uncharacterized protein n=1 Tax=Pneumocystis oryctolagi TaxID=42067 RepID=A0ACB7CEV9_9ASCO|nr:hypothetical protein PORY_001064 [Pneumocystis oryctolagi]
MFRKTALNFGSIYKKGFSTQRPWIPPKIASVGSSLPGAMRINRLVNFYANLPQGPLLSSAPRHWIERYGAAYFDNRGSSKPLLHFVGVLLFFGYLLSYHFHLRYHKHSTHA